MKKYNGLWIIYMILICGFTFGQDCDSEYSMEDDCDICHDAYCYDYVTHQTNTDFPCDGPTEMYVAPDSEYNTEWNASCSTNSYSSFTWDYFTNNSGGPNYPTDCEYENCEIIELSTPSGAMITSSGNLYGVSSPLSININSNYNLIESIDMTLSTLGTQLDYSSVTLNVGENILIPSYEILAEEIDDWGGASVTVKFSWINLEFSEGWMISFSALAEHMSLDQVILELNIGDECPSSGTGDITLDGIVNVNDLVGLVNIILDLSQDELNTCEFSTADVAVDGLVNILDVIATVNTILNGELNRSESSDPTSVEIIQKSRSLSYLADKEGLIGFEITLVHDNQFNLDINKNSIIADYRTINNITRVIIVGESMDNLFKSNKEFDIVDIIAVNTNDYIDVNINSLPLGFGINNIYPNPFNPSTTIEFKMANSGFVKIEIYNALGQNISTLQNGYLDKGLFSFKFNAQNIPTGVYFVRAQAGNEISTKKIMLIK